MSTQNLRKNVSVSGTGASSELEDTVSWVGAELREAIRYLEMAEMQLVEARRWERMRSWYRHFLRPMAIFRNVFFLALLTVVGIFFGLRWKWSFSFAVLCTMVPLLVWVWRASDMTQLKGFLVDVHCSDEVIMELGASHLLEWPCTHPELGVEEKARWMDLQRCLHQRKHQLQQELERSLKQSESEITQNDE